MASRAAIHVLDRMPHVRSGLLVFTEDDHRSLAVITAQLRFASETDDGDDGDRDAGTTSAGERVAALVTGSDANGDGDRDAKREDGVVIGGGGGGGGGGRITWDYVSYGDAPQDSEFARDVCRAMSKLDAFARSEHEFGSDVSDETRREIAAFRARPNG
jgi:hypothetical protein